MDGHLTYSELLAKAGDRCEMVSKWDIGEDEKAQRRFSYWATVPGFQEDAIGDFAWEFWSRKGTRRFI